jgi:hypothetical protein
MTKKLAFLATLFTSSFLTAEVAQAPTLQMNGFTSMVAAGAKQKDNTNGKGGPIQFAIGSSNI